MGAVPDGVDTGAQPPMAVPLQHFVVGLGCLLAAGAVGVLDSLGLLPGLAGPARLHLLLAGWVCLTIMGAMTQFVPVWSGTTLYSTRLAAGQLWAVVVGLAGLVGSLLAGGYAWLPAAGGLVLAGLWAFVYNVGRTLWRARPLDVTERHFAAALGFFLLVTALGVALAVSYTRPLGVPVARGALRATHATLAVFGAVLTTVIGALYQLGTMFTQSDLDDVDGALRRVEEAGYPAGVVLLAAGRLSGSAAVGRIGALLVVVGLASVAVVLARRLLASRVAWTPMLRRYAVVAGATLVWCVGALDAWLRDPTTPAAVFGGPALAPLLLVGVVGFVVAGTLYHVVPFIVWEHRYSDLLGLKDVPVVDDLYSDRLAAVDLVLVLGGTVALVASAVPATPAALAGGAAVAGHALLAGGFAAFAANVLSVLRDHEPRSVGALLRPGATDRRDDAVGGSRDTR